MVLEVAVSDVFVVNNAKNRPFIEQFCHTGVNFTQKDLGTIMGFFIVRDTSSMSENIVNFLVSEIKKYYFSQSQKNPEEKFEATLHRVNRMLEELATIGNVKWLGTIDGAVCAITGTTARFSVTGAASIFLLRDDHLIDIGEGLASTEAAHNPLKTFADISTGELLSYDKIIITSSELLDLVSFEELQKSAIRMGQKNFVQYIQTVLSNQCPIAVTLITDLYPPEEKSAPTVAPIVPLPENFFGATPETAPTPDATEPPTALVTEDDIAPLLATTDNTNGEDYVDPQTGHIYIQGSDAPLSKPSVIDDLSDAATDLLDTTKSMFARRKRWIDKRIARMRTPDTSEQDLSDAEASNIVPSSEPAVPKAVTPSTENVAPESASRPSDTIIIDMQEDLAKRSPLAASLKSAKKIAAKTLFHARCIGDRCIYFVRTHTPQRAPKERAEALSRRNALAPSEKYPQSKDPSVHKQHTANFLPRLSRLMRLWTVLSLRSKLLALGILLIIIAAPLLFSTVRTQLTTNTHTPEETTQPEPEPVTPEPQFPPLTTVASIDDGKTVVQLKGDLVVVGAHTIIFFDGNTAHKALTLPSDAGTIALAAAMDDLNMIFFLTTDNTLYSVSPADGKFTKQPNIPTWDVTKISAIATYMTYMYIATPDGITRHTRIDGGFDAGKSWLKDSFATASVAMAIDENIYLANGTTAVALLSGRKTPFALDQRIIHPSDLFASPQTTSLWIIDTSAATLYKVNKKTGAVESETPHTDLAVATAFVVNEKTSTAYILTENTVTSLPVH